MKPAAFEYHAPTTAAEAVALLSEFGDTAKPLAGGQSLVPMLAMRLATFEHLVDLGRIAELSGIARGGDALRVGAGTTQATIERGGDALRVGAGTTQATIERSPEVAVAVPLLARATPLIGHFQIRNRGTLGGSIAHADPAAEYPAVALALDAQFEVLSPAGTRTVHADQFFTGMFSTAIGDGELLAAVTFPVWAGRSGFAVREFARRHGDFAIAGAAVAVQLDGQDRVARAGISLLGMGATPRRATNAEHAALHTPHAQLDAVELGRLAVADLGGVPADLHGSAAYRRRVGAAMVAAAWNDAIEEAAHA